MNPYEEKQERRRQRLLARASRLHDQSLDAHAKSAAAVEGIPFGQPILVGHHSEHRHRAAIRRAQTQATKANQLQKEANKVASCAESVGQGGISSDDPEAVQKLSAKLQDMRARHTQMKAENKVTRRRHLPWELSNLLANIKRVEHRIEELRQPPPEFQPIDTEDYSIRFVLDPAGNRFVLTLKSRVEKTIFRSIRQVGWLWSPHRQAFVRKPGNSVPWGIAALEGIFKKGEQHDI